MKIISILYIIIGILINTSTCNAKAMSHLPSKKDMVYCKLNSEDSLLNKKIKYPYGGLITNNKYIKTNWKNHDKDTSIVSILLFKQRVSYNKLDISDIVDFSSSHFCDVVDFSNTYFANKAYFDGCVFDSLSTYSWSLFNGEASFSECTFDSLLMINTLFNCETSFIGCTYNKYANYTATYFYNKADFSYVQFHDGINFRRTHFYEGVDLSNTIFDADVDLRDIKSYSMMSFEDAKSAKILIMDGAYICDTMDISGAVFRNGIDLRKANLDSLDILYIDDGTYYPNGMFYVKWNNIKGKINVFDNIDERESFQKRKSQYYTHITSIYEKLRDNYLIQGNRESADAVIYELCQQRAKYLKEWHWVLYGWFFGWGYQSWKFVMFVLLPLCSIGAIYGYRIYKNTQTYQKLIDKYGINSSKITLKVDFTSKMIISVNNHDIPIMKSKHMRQEVKILEEILSKPDKREVHWSYGFVLFKGWRNSIPKRGPEWQFGNEVAGLTTILGREVVKRTGDRKVWTLADNVEVIENSIDRAKIVCDEAHNIEDINQKVNKIIEALILYPRSIKTNCYYVDILRKKNDLYKLDSNDKKYLNIVVNCLGKREYELTEAIKLIQTEADKPNYGDIWSETGYYVVCMAEELKEIQPRLIVARDLIKDLVHNDDELLGMMISEMLNKIKLSKTTDNTRDYYMSSLVNEPFIKECIINTRDNIKEQYKYFVKDIEKKTIEDAVSRSLWWMSRDKVYNFRSGKKLKNYLITCLKSAAFYAVLEERYTIPANQCKDMMRMIKARSDIYKIKINSPLKEDILRKLGNKWNIAKLELALENEKRIKNQIDIDDEWLLSHGVSEDSILASDDN